MPVKRKIGWISRLTAMNGISFSQKPVRSQKEGKTVASPFGERGIEGDFP